LPVLRSYPQIGVCPARNYSKPPPKLRVNRLNSNCGRRGAQTSPLDRDNLRIAMRSPRGCCALHQPSRVFQPARGRRRSRNRTCCRIVSASASQSRWNFIGSPTGLAELVGHLTGHRSAAERPAPSKISVDGDASSCRSGHLRCQWRLHFAGISQIQRKFDSKSNRSRSLAVSASA